MMSGKGSSGSSDESYDEGAFKGDMLVDARRLFSIPCLHMLISLVEAMCYLR